MTRQILPYGTASASVVEFVLFVLTVVIGYGIGTWAVIGYTGKISKELRTKSRLINIMYLTVPDNPAFITWYLIICYL